MSQRSLKFTKTTCKTKHNWDTRTEEFCFEKKKNGGLALRVKAWVEKETSEVERCDLGHAHRVVKEEIFIYENALLTKNQKQELIEWLTKSPDLHEKNYEVES
jgi:serine/threonine-protein kinase RIO1